MQRRSASAVIAATRQEMPRISLPQAPIPVPAVRQPTRTQLPAAGFLGVPERAWKAWEGRKVGFMNFSVLNDRLREELPKAPRPGAPMDPELRSQVEEMLRNTRLNRREWEQHAVWRPGRYTRTIVGYSPGQYIALMLCWAPGQQSPIHDHAGAHCFIKMLSGRLCEEHFDWTQDGRSSTDMSSSGELDASDGALSVGFMHDDVGLHRIRNPSRTEGAVSLHIYTPPFTQCKVFPPTGGAPKLAAMASSFASAMAPMMQVVSLPSLSLGQLWETLGSLARGTEGGPESQSVRDVVDSLELSAGDHATYCSASHFSEFGVVHSLAHADDCFSVVVSCWGPGQAMEPQKVGLGRSSWLKVVRGSISVERLPEEGLLPWTIAEGQTEDLAEGSTTVFENYGEQCIQKTNTQSDKPAVTVQVFSPPLTQFVFKTRRGLKRWDIPRMSAPPLTSMQEAAPTSRELSATRADKVMRTRGRQFLSLQDIDDLVGEELAANPRPSNHIITELLRRAKLNPEEWRSYLKDAAEGAVNGPGPCIVPLSRQGTHEMVLALWQHGQWSWGSDGKLLTGRRSWTLVLEGELQEEIMAEVSRNVTYPVRVSTLKEESLTFLDGETLYQRSCDSEAEPCVSLHIMCPGTSPRLQA